LVPQPKTVRYAWSGVPHSTLTNTASLPACSFRTDSFAMDTLGTREEPTERFVGTKSYGLVIGEGRISSFAVHGKQLLSNELGASGGVCVPGFLGPQGFGSFKELGPDLISLSNPQRELLIALAPDGMTWTITNRGKEAFTARIALSPLVKVSDLDAGNVTLTRPNASVKVAGIDKVDAGEQSRFLEVQLGSKASKNIVFSFAAK
jgi:hypothetical protein